MQKLTISFDFIDLYVNHDRLVSLNIVLRQYSERKKSKFLKILWNIYIYIYIYIHTYIYACIYTEIDR